MNEQTNQRLDFLRSRIGQSTSDSSSPFGRWLNGTIQVADYGKLVANFSIRAEMTNPAGVLHGGAAAAILDDLIGTMVFAMGREYAYTTINLNIDYLHTARVGEVITTIAEVIRSGKTIIHCEGHILSADNRIVAKCTTNLTQTSVRLTL